jgi:hypothetical protein
MRVGHTGGAGLACGAAHHDPEEVEHRQLVRLVPTPVRLLSSRQALLQVLVDDKVDHGLTDAPPRGGEALPEALQSALRMDPSYDRRKGGLTAVQLEPGLDQPDGVRGAGTDES